jgi:hypothetical protein
VDDRSAGWEAGVQSCAARVRRTRCEGATSHADSAGIGAPPAEPDFPPALVAGKQLGLEPLPLPSAQLAAQVRGRHLLGIVTRTRPPAALRRRTAFDISTAMDGRVTCVIAAARPAAAGRS